MSKATRKQVRAPNLGTKRNCPSCGTKFYDFGKTEIVCPKCASTLNADELETLRAIEPPAKRAGKTEKLLPDDVVIDTSRLLTDDSEAIESLEDLDDQQEDVLENLNAEEDGEDEKY